MSERYPGGFITKTPPTVSTSSAYGVWTLDQALQYIKAGTWPVSDPYFFYNTLLLPGNGTNGAQNNTFLDSSTNNFTITRNGNTTQGTFTPYGSNWSNYFNGTDAYLITGTSSNLTLANNADWTVEAWIFLSASTYQQILFNSGGGSDSWSTQHNCDFAVNSSGFLSFEYSASGTSTSVAGTTATTRNAWNHIAWVFNGTSKTLTTYVNGVRDLNATSVSGYTPPNATPRITIGRTDPTVPNPYQWWVTGYISNVRVVRGSQVYSGATITVPTGPLTAITNTSLLTCQSNRFVDNSSNAFAITVSGSPSVQRFSPFKPSAPYAAGTIGGSGYFDGSGDYLSLPFTTPLQLGTGDFTIEFWMYAIGFGGVISQSVVDEGSGNNTGWTMLCGPASVGMYMQGFDISTLVQSGSYSRAWTHVAVTRSGTTFRLFVNGVLSKTLSGTYDMNAAYNVRPDTPTLVGTHELQYPNYYTGYVSSLRILKGSALYTATFTPPTAPLTAITNTQLLLNYTNGGIIDNAMMNDLETVGNAQISTTQSKFGGSSISIPGGGANAFILSSPNLDMGTGDFTIECWVNSTSIAAAYPTFISSVTGWSSGASGHRFNNTGASNKFTFHLNGAGDPYMTSTNTFSFGVWYHYALTRSGNTFRMFVNGNLEATGTSYSGSYNAALGGMRLGYSQWDGTNGYYNGYIDDLRITKGYARYTANFTPPIAAFPLS